MSILELKEKYNTLLQREKGAEVFLNKATDKEFDKWFPKFMEITKELSGMMTEYKTITGQEMSIEICLNGIQ